MTRAGPTEKSMATRICEGLCALLMAALVVLLFIQVVTRYLLQDPPVWTEELARAVFIYMIFIAGGVVIRRRANLRIDTFVNMLSRRLQWGAMIVSAVGAVIFLATCVITGISFVERLSRQPMTSLPVSKAFVFVGIPIGCAIMLAYEAARLFELRLGLPSGEPADLSDFVKRTD